MASFTFAAGNARKLLRLPLYALGALAATVVPRSPRLWVFGSGIGPGEGALPLYRLARERFDGAGGVGGVGGDTRLVWLATTDAELATARALGLDAEPKSSWRGFALTLRARVLVITHGFGDVNRYATRGGFVVQLWHGIPLKRLHLDSPAALRVSFLPDHRLVRAVMGRAYRFAGRGISLFPVASAAIAPRIASAFGIPRDRIVMTGDPRDDVLLTGTEDSRRAAALAMLPGARTGARRILYAPTWRDGHPDPSVPNAAQWVAITDWLEAHDAELWLRTHPLGSGDYAAGPRASPRIRMLGSDIARDVTPLLPAFDALITDYSSIAFDVALLQRPIVFLAPDVESYTRSRGLYESYRDVSGGRHVTTWQHALATLGDRWKKDGGSGGPHEHWLRDENVDLLDGRATERVLAEILRRTGTPSVEPVETRPASRTPRPVVSSVELGADSLRVTIDGAVGAPVGATVGAVWLDGARARVDGVVDSGGTTVTFPLLAARWGEPGLALPSGDYRVTLDGTPPTTRLEIAADLPELLTHPLFHAEVLDEGGGLVVRISAPLAPDERGPAAQRRLERAYRRSRAPLEDAVFFESFYGQSASDNPLGIDAALAELSAATTRYWSVVDGSVAVPDGAVRIIEGSREWWHARGTARVLVVNDWLRKRFRRRAGQHVVQTWHGTMLKRLALDRGGRGIRTRIAVLRERARWDALLAQNPYSARIFASAYAMRGPIWQDGYPRNDVLNGAEAERAETAARVRAVVGIREGVRVVLYAPTWRDDRTEMVDYVDLASFAGELGDDHVLLVRGHSRTLRYGRDLSAVGLIDVTSYPSMADLLLVADVFVTDYSSAMFDFAGTGRPMVFFTPDLAHYSADLRGFYFDLLAEAPGPVVSERADLRDAIVTADADAASGRHDERLAAWRERFTPLDDGDAGRRVVRRMRDAGWI